MTYNVFSGTLNPTHSLTYCAAVGEKKLYELSFFIALEGGVMKVNAHWLMALCNTVYFPYEIFSSLK